MGIQNRQSGGNNVRRFIFFCLPFLIYGIPPAIAEDSSQSGNATLEQVLRHVYVNSPELEASRAELRALHELHPQALAGWKPTAEVETSVYATDIDSSNFANADGATTKDINVRINQPLYRGGKTTAETERSYSLIKAGYARFLQKEQEVFLRATTAYMDVLRDRTLLNLRINNEKILGEELAAVRERHNAGDVTQTDVRQAEARLARARAEHVAASGQLESSRAAFEAITGFAPNETLYVPGTSVQFPSVIEEMVSRAETENPALAISVNQHEAAQNDIDARFSELLPQVSAFASYNKQFDPQPGVIDESETKTIGVRAKIPLYEAGFVRSRVREAKSIASQRNQEVNEQRRLIRRDITDNWKTLESARAEIAARNAETDAARAALEGVREEAKMGERTVLDVLDADQDVLSAEAALARAHHDEVIASYALAAAIGWLLPEKMGMADIAYQPGPHYRAMSRKIFSMNAEK